MASTAGSVMSKVTSLLMTVTDFYKDINPSTLSGAIDIVVVQHQDGSLAASPFHVRFGKLQLLRPYEKVVEVKINDQVVPDLKMKVGDAGEAFFVVETDDPSVAPSELATSPITHPVSPMTAAATALTAAATSTSPLTSATTVSAALEPLDLGESMSSTATATAATASTTAATLHAVTLNTSTPSSNAFIPNDATADARLTPAPVLSDDLSPLDAVIATAVAASPDLAASTPMSPVQQVSPQVMDGELTASPKLTAVDEPVPEVTDDLANSYHSASEFELSDQDVPITNADADNENAPPSPSHIAIDVDHVPASSKSTAVDIHPFSDTELDMDSRDHVHAHSHKSRTSPKSDTELEFHELSTSPPASSSMKWMWGWGKMPTVSKPSSAEAAGDRGSNSPSPTTPTASQMPVARSLEAPAIAGDLDGGAGEDGAAPVAMSLAGFRKDLTHAEFQSKRISHSHFLSQASALLTHPNLVVRMQGQYYPWSVAAPMLASMLAFGQPLPSSTVEQMLQAAPTVPAAATESKPSRRSTWRWWSRSSANTQGIGTSDRGGVGVTPASLLGEFHGDPPSAAAAAVAKPTLADTGRAQSELAGHLLSPTSPSDATLAASGTSPPLRSQSTGAIDLPASPVSSTAGSPPQAPVPKKHYFKTLRLTSDQLKSLPLRRGINHVTFTVLSSLQGAAECHSRIFLWDSTEHVVISDIDGTITKSDALGHIFTMLGRDWTHSGVASLYTQVRNNGYQMLYLTSRAIGQAQYTRNYLNKVEQGTYQLPDGPVFLSPDRLVAAFTREVIQRRPEEFKVACLRDIRALFAPDTKSPFYAGFGNRHTDAYSYRAVGVPTSRIFTINPDGELKRELLEGYKATYLDLGNLVDQIFPPVGTRHVVDNEFNDWSFWRRGLPTVPIELLGLDDDDEAESEGDGLGEPPGDESDDAGRGSSQEDDDDEDDFEMPGALTELPPNSRIGDGKRAAGKHRSKKPSASAAGNVDTSLGTGNKEGGQQGEDGEYDGEDEGGEGEEEEEEEEDQGQSNLDRVAEFAAFPYI
ncbi:Lipin/Ned1/Smp2-domain-containing protein [Catenaria anguillulae PL171]|uniref:phosphatidate phosphatase n=1 Tax=Catenaria anguillulae PL171 TaxID=765915 RepID=A0A1Y2HJG0_9FUNG|nr:Lipin/Ned1/Smp2-domain-containing protein [Catenaria anguillulae PL171]